MTTGNKELFDLLSKIDIAATDKTTRENNKKMLAGLCNDEYEQAPTAARLTRFVTKVNENKTVTLKHPFQDSSTATAATVPPPALAANEQPGALFQLARHKLLMINIYDRIQRCRDDVTVDKKDSVFLDNVSFGFMGRTAVNNEFKFEKFEESFVTSDLTLLESAADLKSEKIKKARVKATTELGALETKTKDLIKKLSADETTNDSIAQFLHEVESPAVDETNIEKQFNYAFLKIGQDIKALETKHREEGRKYWIRSKSQQKEQKKEKEDLKETKRVLITLQKMMDERVDRMESRQKELKELSDALCLRSIQSGLRDYESRGGFPAGDKPLEVGVVYYEEKTNAAGVEVYSVKFLGVNNQPAQVEYPKTQFPTGMLDVIAQLKTDKKIVDKSDDFQIKNNLTGLQEIHDWVEDIDQDRQECKQLWEACLRTAKDPKKYKHQHQHANFFLRIYAQHNKNSREMRIVEEIINQDGSVDKKSPKHSFVGERIASQEIFLNKNQAKRTTCKTSSGDIVLETRVQKRQDKDVISVVNKTSNWGSLTEEAKQESAMLFASDLLIKAKPGDYIRLSGKESDAEQAQMVYVALLLLTMPEPDEKQEKALKFNASRIKVNVPGVKLPGMRQLHLQWNEKWREAYAHEQVKPGEPSLAINPKLSIYKQAVDETRKKMAAPKDTEGERLVENRTYFKTP